MTQFSLQCFISEKVYFEYESLSGKLSLNGSCEVESSMEATAVGQIVTTFMVICHFDACLLAKFKTANLGSGIIKINMR